VKNWIIYAGIFAVLCVIVAPCMAITKDYGDVCLSSNGAKDSGTFADVWDLTKGDMVIRFTYDANGLVDDSGAHAYGAFGIREAGYGNDFNPLYAGEDGLGVWLATDYDWSVNTFDPDLVGFRNLDLDDRLLLMYAGGHGEESYNLPSTPPVPGNNHRFWFDRDGGDYWQEQLPAVDGGTFNTGGIYDIEIMIHSINMAEGTAYMTINGLDQGFETDGDWKTIELSPAGITFFAMMDNMQVVYGLYGFGGDHSICFKNIRVTGELKETAPVPEFPSLFVPLLGIVGMMAVVLAVRSRH
jgi:hypothetical protein